MKIKIGLLILLSGSLLLSCSKRNKLSLQEEQKIEETQVADFSSTDLFTGERKPEIRRTDPSHPPVVLDISGNIPVKALDLASYYPSARSLKLRHPKEKEGIRFIIPEGMVMWRIVKGVPSPTLNEITVCNNRILVGNLSGLFCFDKDGNYLHTLLETKEFNQPEQSSQPLQIDLENSTDQLAGFSVNGDLCLFVSITAGKSSLHLYDLAKGQEVYRKEMPMKHPVLLDVPHKTILDYNYNVTATQPEPIMYSLSAKGDTLCSFTNGNRLTDVTGMNNYQNPGDPNLYYADNGLHVRQQGNDTLFRFQTEYELNPAYIFKTGPYKATIQDIVKGNLKGKRSIGSVVETDKLLLFTFKGTEGIFYYDKQSKKVYGSPSNGEKGNACVLHSSDSGYLIPIDRLQGNGAAVFAALNKKDIEHLLQSPRYNKEQKSKFAQIGRELHTGEVWLLLMEE